MVKIVPSKRDQREAGVGEQRGAVDGEGEVFQITCLC